MNCKKNEEKELWQNLFAACDHNVIWRILHFYGIGRCSWSCSHYIWGLHIRPLNSVLFHSASFIWPLRSITLQLFGTHFLKKKMFRMLSNLSLLCGRYVSLLLLCFRYKILFVLKSKVLRFYVIFLVSSLVKILT